MEEANSSKFEGEDSVKSSEIRADMLDETDPFFIDTAKWMNSMGQLLKEDPYTGQDGLFEWNNVFYNNEIIESLYDSESDEEHSNHIDSLFLPALESYGKQDLEILNEIYQNVISVLVIGKPICMQKKYQEDIMETLRGLYDIYADHEPVKNDEMENNMITYSEYHAWTKYKSKYENGEIKCSISLWDNNKTHITKNWRADELKLDYYSNLNKASLLYQINFHNGLIQTRESLLSIFSHHLPDSYFVICFMEFIKFYLNICYEKIKTLDEIESLDLYAKIWQNFIMSTLEVEFERFLVESFLHDIEFETKTPSVMAMALNFWKSTFFSSTDRSISSDVRVLIRKEHDGHRNATSPLHNSHATLNSYVSLGFVPGDEVFPNLKPTMLFFSKFMSFHLLMYPSIQTLQPSKNAKYCETYRKRKRHIVEALKKEIIYEEDKKTKLLDTVRYMEQEMDIIKKLYLCFE